MTEGVALRLLERTMGWDDPTARNEAAWLSLISDFKYDSYREYLAGSRFVESLVIWLQQFPMSHRAAAYDYVRRNLIFVSAPEMRHLVERFYPEVIEPLLLDVVAARLEVPPFLIWSDERTEKELHSALRRTLFFGLSDGARIDAFRRANEGRISNEQVVVAADIHPDKWDDILKELKEAEGPEARFDRVFLIDDFIGSGTTLLRWDTEKAGWAGRMFRFWQSHKGTFQSHFSPEWKLHVHHYVATYLSTTTVQVVQARAREALAPDWFDEVQFTFGMVFPESLPLRKDRDAEMWALTEDFYDASIQTKATEKGGEHVKRGFSDGGLPVVLEHNTPNNSLALLWADTPGRDGAHPMRPLFRRAQRHW